MPSALEVALGAALIPDRLIYTRWTADASVAWFPNRFVALDLRMSAGDQDHYLSPILRTPVTDIDEIVVSERYLGTLSLQFAPLPGEAELGGTPIRMDPYVLAGTGLVGTTDEFSVCCPQGPVSETYRQTHPALVVGGGIRFREAVWGARFQVDQARWIEVVDQVHLQMSRRLSLSAALTATLGSSE